MTVRSKNLPLLAAALAASALLALSACDSGGGDPPAEENAAPTAEATASADTVTAGQTITLDGADSSDPDGDEMSYSWTLSGPDSSDATFSSQIGVEVQFTADVAGDYDATLLISDGEHEDTDETSAFARQPLPTTVVVGFQRRAASGDSLVAGTLVYKRAGQPDSTVAENQADGSLTLPFSETEAELCFQEGTYFRRNCEPITPDADRDLTFEAVRKQVSVAATVDPDDANLQSIIHGDVETEAEGELAAELDKRSGERKLLAFKKSYKRDSAMVSADADASESFALEAKPECNDEIDNDSDGYVDAEDPGCDDGSLDGGYDPQDDNETHDAFVREFLGLARDTSFVSSHPDHWENLLASTDLPASAQAAIGEIFFASDVKLSSTQSGEGFAVRFKCGPSYDQKNNVNVTDVVPDSQSVDGWYEARTHGVNKSWFSSGTHCDIAWVHEAFVRNNPGDGHDDVIFETTSRAGYAILGYNFEPDEVPDDSQSTNSARRVRTGADNRTNTKVVRNGDLERVIDKMRGTIHNR